jgi:hypothetical protein
LQGALYQEIDVSESMWQIERANKVVDGKTRQGIIQLRPIVSLKSILNAILTGTLTLHLWKKAPTGVPWPVLIVGPVSPDKPDALDPLSLFSLGEALESGRPEYGIQADSATALHHYAKVLPESVCNMLSRSSLACSLHTI